MVAIAAVIAIGVVATAIILVLGWIQAARTRAVTRAGLARASGDATDEQLLGLVTRSAPDERVREATSEIDAQDIQRSVEQMRVEESGSAET